jgi:phage protein D
MPTPRFSIEVDGSRLPAATLGRVVGFEVHEGDGIIGRAVIRFRLGQGADGRYPVLDDGPFLPGAAILLTLAAPGGSDVTLFSGLLVSLRPHFEEPEANSYLEVVAADHAVLLAAEDRVASYPDAADSDAAAEIARRYGLAFDAEDTPSRLAADDMLLIQRADDWSFLRHLAARNGYVVYFEPDPVSGAPTCHFHPRRLEDTSQADLTILREAPNLDWIDFQIAHDRPETRFAAAIDAVAKRLIRSDQRSEAPVLGEGLFATQAADGLRGAGAGGAARHLRGGLPRDAALNAHAAGRMAEDHLVIEARGGLDPALYRGLLRAHRPVLIKGVGERLSSSYYVAEVLTTMQDGTLRQRFAALSNALGRQGSEAFGQSAEEVAPA